LPCLVTGIFKAIAFSLCKRSLMNFPTTAVKLPLLCQQLPAWYRLA
jgi:hypothetical protein